MCSNRWRRHVVSEGPLKGPDGTSVAVDAATDDDERVLWSGGGTDSGEAIAHRCSQTRWTEVNVRGNLV